MRRLVTLILCLAFQSSAIAQNQSSDAALTLPLVVEAGVFYAETDCRQQCGDTRQCVQCTSIVETVSPVHMCVPRRVTTGCQIMPSWSASSDRPGPKTENAKSQNEGPNPFANLPDDKIDPATLGQWERAFASRVFKLVRETPENIRKIKEAQERERNYWKEYDLRKGKQ